MSGLSFLSTCSSILPFENSSLRWNGNDFDAQNSTSHFDLNQIVFLIRGSSQKLCGPLFEVIKSLTQFGNYGITLIREPDELAINVSFITRPMSLVLDENQFSSLKPLWTGIGDFIAIRYVPYE